MVPYLQANQKIAGYQVQELVGKGGMGEVYRARQLSMDRIVALKVLSAKLAKQDPSFAKRFVDEARAAGRLNHPNIIAVHDVGKTTMPVPEGAAEPGEEVYYFSMEYVQGETVKDVIVREGTCSTALTDQVMTAMAEALVYAESQGIVHRDIKPDNIMITSTGSVKLADLGLAQQVGSEDSIEGGDKDAKGARRIMGTPMYMSPEQARGLSVDHRSDQYSLGATLFHMLTGRPPFKGEGSKAVMRAHVFDPVPDPSAVTTDEIPEAWRQLTMRMMAKNPNERFANAADMRAAIRQAIAGQPMTPARRVPRHSKVTAALPPTRPREGMPPLVIGGIVAVVVVVALVIVGALLGQGPEAGPAVDPAPLATPSDPKPAVDANLARVRSLIDTLPGDHAASLEKLSVAMADPAFADPACRDLLLAERERRQRIIDERKKAGKEAQLARLEPIEKAIAGGHFASAREALAAFAKDAVPNLVPERSAEVEAKLRTGLQALHLKLLAAVPMLGDIKQIEPLIAAVPSTGLDAAQQKELVAALQLRRDQLEKQAAAEAAAAAIAEQEQGAWKDLAGVIDGLRGAARYQEMRAAASDHAPRFVSPQSQELVLQYDEIGKLADKAETYLRNHIKNRTPQVTVPPARKIYLTDLLPKEATYRLQPSGSQQLRLDRASLGQHYKDLLEQAFANLPSDINQDRQRFIACYLWVWRMPEAKSLLAAMPDDKLARAIAAVERHIAVIPTHGQVGKDGEQVIITYDFSGKDPALLQDFAGDCSYGDKGLLWKTDKVMAKGDIAEASLPTLRWKLAMSPPMRIEAKAWFNRDTQLALIGVQSGQHLARIGFNLRTPDATTRVGALVTRDDATSFLTSRPVTINLDLQVPVTVEMLVDAAWKVSMNYNGSEVRFIPKDPPGEKTFQLAEEGPLSVVMQIYQGSGSGSIQLGSLTIQGLDPILQP